MLRFVKVRPVKDPARGTELSAGIDFFIPNNFEAKRVYNNESILIPSGIKVKVPAGHVLIAFNKSGIASKKCLLVGACVVDEDYQGEIHINLMNVGTESQVLSPGDKIVQFVLLPVNYAGLEEATSLEDLYPTTTERGEGAFGSTGLK